jgi:Ca2+-binding EF-hand superfamily protein
MNSWLTAGACALALTLAGSAFAQAGDPVAGKTFRERVRAEKAAQRVEKQGVGDPAAGKTFRERVRAERAAQRVEKQGAAANRPVRDQQGLSFQAVMRQADKDKNGTISPDEFREAMDKVFKEADANGDGVLQRNEIGRANRALLPAGDTTGQRPEPPAANIWERVLAQDKDGDGKISQSEWQGAPERFKRMDKNGDGFVTQEEVRQAASERVRNAAQAQRGQGAGGPGGPGGPRLAPEERAANLLKTQDQDGDGKVSATEFKGREQAFRRMDKNNDGFLTLQELLETGRQMRERRGQQGGDGPFPPQPPDAPQPPQAPRAKSS